LSKSEFTEHNQRAVNVLPQWMKTWHEYFITINQTQKKGGYGT
jgi:hypothetical protein